MGSLASHRRSRRNAAAVRTGGPRVAHKRRPARGARPGARREADRAPAGAPPPRLRSPLEALLCFPLFCKETGSVNLAGRVLQVEERQARRWHSDACRLVAGATENGYKGFRHNGSDRAGIADERVRRVLSAFIAETLAKKASDS